MTAEDRKLRRIVSEFRKGIIGDKNSRNYCYMIAAPLEGYLNLIGYQCHLVTQGTVTVDDTYHQHVWLELPDHRIIDPTADQFPSPDGKKMPEVYIGRLPSWYEERFLPPSLEYRENT